MRSEDSMYYVGKKYHNQLIKILWEISRVNKLSFVNQRKLDNLIVELENIFEEDNQWVK